MIIYACAAIAASNGIHLKKYITKLILFPILVYNEEMPEQLSNSSIEAEIAELSQKIAEKRQQLEAGKGIIEERDLLKSAVVEKFTSTPSQGATSTTTQTTSQKVAQTAVASTADKSYLDTLDPDSRLIVEGLVESVFRDGMAKTLKDLELQEPYIIDAFHDELTDKLYDELKKRGVLK